MFKMKLTFDAYQVHIKAPNQPLFLKYAAQTHRIPFIENKEIIGELQIKFDKVRINSKLHFHKRNLSTGA